MQSSLLYKTRVEAVLKQEEKVVFLFKRVRGDTIIFLTRLMITTFHSYRSLKERFFRFLIILQTVPQEILAKLKLLVKLLL